jgi:hypothetical protein
MTYPSDRHDAPGLSDMVGMLGFFRAAGARIHVPVHRWGGWHRASAALLAGTIGWGALMAFTLRNGERAGDSAAGGARPVEADEAARLRAKFALELARITSIERSEALRSPFVAAASLSDGDLIDLLGGLAADAALKIERFKPIGGSDDATTNATTTGGITSGAPVRDGGSIGQGRTHAGQAERTGLAEDEGLAEEAGHAGYAEGAVAVEEGDWVQRNVAITVSGSYSGVADWVGRLALADRPIGIERLHVEPEKTGLGVRVSADLKILGLRTVMASREQLPLDDVSLREHVVSLADPFASDTLVEPRIVGRMSGAGRTVEVAVHAQSGTMATPVTKVAETAEMKQSAVEVNESAAEMEQPAAKLTQPAAEAKQLAVEMRQPAREMRQLSQNVLETQRGSHAGLGANAKQAEHLDEDRRSQETDDDRSEGALPAGSTASEVQAS